MAEVIFYEKSGCSGNARQKALLKEAGHRVLARDLRDCLWTDSRLLEFLAALPVARWFNPNAPAVKSGEIVPATLDVLAALALLRANPLLIRRPLLQVGDELRVGFDAADINAWIGLGEVPDEDLETCRHGGDPHAGGCTP